MSIRHMAEAWYTPSLAPNQRLVALALADYADDHGRCYPSLKNIGAKTGYSRRQTSRLVNQLVEMGYVEILIEATWNRTPLYQLHPEAFTPYERYPQPDLPMMPDIDAVEDALVEAARGGGDNLTPPDRSSPQGGQSDTPEVTDGAQELDAGVTLNRQEPSVEPSEEPSLLEEGADEVSRETSDAELERFSDTTEVETLRPRNRAWDALTAIFEYVPEGNEQALWGKISREAHESADDPERGSGDPGMEIMIRADRMLRQWGAKALTPPSLLKHWKRFGSRLGAATDEEVNRIRDTWEREQRRQRMAELEATNQLEEST